MLNFLKPSTDAQIKVPDKKIKGVFHRRKMGVLIGASASYVGYYIIRLIFTTE